MKKIKFFLATILLLTAANIFGQEKDSPKKLNDKYLIKAEVMPEPIGGLSAIQKKVIYPEIAKRAGIEGRVSVKVYIDEKGDVVNTEILKGIGSGCDEAALKAIKETKFIPAKQKGKLVNVEVIVPVLFKLSKSSQK